MLERPRDRLLAELAVVLGHVRAPAVVQVARDRVVVVAVDRRDPAVLDQPAHLVRVRPVADEVPAAVTARRRRSRRSPRGSPRAPAGSPWMSVITATRFNSCPLLVVVGRGGSTLGHERLDQLPHVVVELVANPSDDLERLAGGIGDRPVLIALARVHRARVPAAQRDHDVGGADHRVGERLGELRAHVQADLRHRLHDHRVDLLVGVRPGRANGDPALRQCVGEARGHLAAPGVALAHEQHLRQRLLDRSGRLRDRPQLLAGEPLDDHRQEVRAHRRPVADLLVGGLDVAPDRLGREHAVELVREPHRRGVEAVAQQGRQFGRHGLPRGTNAASL